MLQRGATSGIFLGGRHATEDIVNAMSKPFTVVLLLGAGLLGCRPSAEVRDSHDLGVLETNPLIKGRDGGYSGLYQGRSVWLYGDSILQEAGEDGSSWRHNTWSWTDDLRASDGVTGFEEPVDSLGAPREFFAKTEAEAAYLQTHEGEDCIQEPCGAREVLWPGPLVEDVEGDRALVFYTKIHGEPGEWSFYPMGCGVAVWEDWEEGPVRSEVRPDTAHPTLLWKQGAGNCVSGAVVEGGLLYAWACGGDLSKPCNLGRVRLRDVEDPAAWSWLTKSGDWSASQSEAESQFSGMDMTSVHYNEWLLRYVAVYSEPLSNRIMLRTAKEVEGPWSKPTVAAVALEPWRDDVVSYSGLGHGELAREGFEYVTYYRETGDWQGEIRLVEVELDLR